MLALLPTVPSKPKCLLHPVISAKNPRVYAFLPCQSDFSSKFGDPGGESIACSRQDQVPPWRDARKFRSDKGRRETAALPVPLHRGSIQLRRPAGEADVEISDSWPASVNYNGAPV